VHLEPDMPPDRQMALMFIENEHRIPVSPIDEGLFYKSLLEQGWTKARVAHKLQVSGPRINNRLDIIALQPEIQAMFLDGRLPLLSADDLLAIKDEGDRLRLAKMLAGRNLALGRIEALAAEVAEHGMDHLLQTSRSQYDRKAAKKQPGGEARRFPEGERIGLAALQVAARATCKACDAAPYIELPKQVAGEEANDAASGVCDVCPVRDLVDACALCPLVDFLGRLAGDGGSHGR
jgi:hypothetical protein